VSAVNQPELVAELKESLRVHASWLKRLNGRLVELENERTQIIDALPVCPTCDGNRGQECTDRRHYIVGQVRRNDVHDDVRCPRPCMEVNGKRWLRCLDCTDGKMSVEWMAAIVNAVMATTYDHLAWTTDQVKAGQYDTHPIIASLRAVKP